MNVVVTGGTGFTGSYLIPLLIAQGHAVRCFVRDSSDRSVLPAIGTEWVEGDLADIESLKRAFSGMDGLVNVASIGFGHAPNIVKAALETEVERAVFVSTTAIYTTLDVASKRIRLSAEDEIRQSRLAYTIVRPTMIYGSSRDRNMCRLIRYLSRYRVIPIFGNGKYLQQPVYVKDVAKALVEALSAEKTVGKAYNIAGARPVTYNEIIDTISSLMGRKIQKMPLPASPFVRGLHIAERIGLGLPVKAEQILRLNEDKVFDFSEAAKDFGYSSRSFEEGIRLELEEMGIGHSRGKI
jgi:nucleoside-diphosphate-sugar epimerase